MEIYHNIYIYIKYCKMGIPKLDSSPWEGPRAWGPSQGEEPDLGIPIFPYFMYFGVYFHIFGYIFSHF